LLHHLKILSENPEILQDYHAKLRYIMVDEYQDTNVVQYKWLRLLALQSQNLCCVGDDDQSIYGWRGAEIANILNFARDYPNAKTVRLEQNYRSTPEILAAASSLIAHNTSRLRKTLWTDAPSGEKIRVRILWDGRSEANFIADNIETLMAKGTHLNQIAILVRTSNQTRAFEEILTQRGLPYLVYGGLRFYERAEIRDAIAYLRLIRQSADELAFDRIINVPKRGVGDRALAVIHQIAREQNRNMIDATRIALDSGVIKGAARAGLAVFLRQYAMWRQAASDKKLDQLAAQVLEESKYTEMWQNDPAPTSRARLDNLRELQQAMREFENLTEFLDHVALVTELYQDNEVEKVSIMTLHLAKGLEFDQVFLPGWEEKLFPHARALDESGQRGLEEERRLAYVGLTRARQQAVISWAANRLTFDKWEQREPSRFLHEIDAKTLVFEREEGLPGFGEHNAPQSPTILTAGEGRHYGNYAPMIEGRSSAYNNHDAHARRNMLQTAAADIWSQSPKHSENMVNYQRSDRVSHANFGEGTVLNVLGSGASIGLEIEFDQSGRKKIMARFVTKL
ncbi:MAG: UvrD-helicase domain-containing protein, partial [Alphaproteobacteria bacterium]|nr:UvrD-helicase domain-containing protein [Alphaproteobacteria bacterium]